MDFNLSRVEGLVKLTLLCLLVEKFGSVFYSADRNLWSSVYCISSNSDSPLAHAFRLHRDGFVEVLISRYLIRTEVRVKGGNIKTHSGL